MDASAGITGAGSSPEPQEGPEQQESPDLQEALELAISLAQDAGRLAVAEQSRAHISTKGGGTDLVTHVDLAAERRIVAALADRFTDHSILGEEKGEQGAASSPWRWLIDPLDGTNNYAMGLDVYGVCITLCEDGEPILAVIHDSPGERTFWAVRGGGAWSISADDTEAQRLSVPPVEDLAHATVSWLQGYRVPLDDPERRRMFDALEMPVKRVLRTWAPSADWGLLARGGLGGLVAYRNEIWDMLGGMLLATEAGASASTGLDGDLLIVAPEPLHSALRSLLLQS